MLRSWIDRLERGLSPSARAGLVFGRDRIGLVVLDGDDPEKTVRHAREIWSGRRLDPADKDTLPGVIEAVITMTADIANRYLPIHVSLADSLAQSTVLELDSLPADRKEQNSLARFRLEREAASKPTSVQCQSLGDSDGKALLLATSLAEDWQAYIGEVLKQVGLAPASIGINLFRQYNRFHDRLLAGGHSGALLMYFPESWSMLIWDKLGRPRFVRSRARQNGADDREVVVGELERLILAYVHGGGNRTVDNIHVLSVDATLAEALDRRLRTPCVRLDPHDGVHWESGADKPGGIVPMALAAALA